MQQLLLLFQRVSQNVPVPFPVCWEYVAPKATHSFQMLSQTFSPIEKEAILLFELALAPAHLVLLTAVQNIFPFVLVNDFRWLQGISSADSLMTNTKSCRFMPQ